MLHGMSKVRCRYISEEDVTIESVLDRIKPDVTDEGILDVVFDLLDGPRMANDTELQNEDAIVKAVRDAMQAKAES